jgi:hypothetical protein
MISSLSQQGAGCADCGASQRYGYLVNILARLSAVINVSKHSRHEKYEADELTFTECKCKSSFSPSSTVQGL